MSSKMHHNGRGKGNDPHARHYRWQTQSKAWQALKPIARCLEMELKALYNGSNNGDLFLSVREAAKRLGIAPNTADKAFKELQEKGFILPNQKGSFSYKLRHATSWILTEYDYNNKLATKEFMRWPFKEKNRTQNLTHADSRINTPAQNLIPNMVSTASQIDTDKAPNIPISVANIDT